MNLLTQNAKMKKTSKENKAKILNFSIPAYKTKSGKSTCPFAGGCQAYCYAQKGNYTRFPIVQEQKAGKVPARLLVDARPTVTLKKEIIQGFQWCRS